VSSPTVLILGAGINGVAIARELLLNRIGVVIVDARDTCYGATAYSSRLIHGGLRYLEYGEFDLVRESVEERDRLLRLAPEFVRPLELFIPTSSFTGGLIGSIGRFMGWRWWPGVRGGRRRGKWLVQMGLEMYDLYAGDALPRHRTMKAGTYNSPPVNRRMFSSVCRYFDAQVQYPERFVMSMLHDCRKIAADHGLPFELHTYCEARLESGRVRLERTATVESAPAPTSSGLASPITPSAILNATGAWVDHTLARLPQPSKRLIGGTRGTHLFLFHAELREMLHGKGIYVEADDGRPIFILPLGESVLVGTTDEPFEQPPETAVATEADIAYLLRAVKLVFPDADVRESDVNFHGCGVRPLPFVDRTSTSAITRRHMLHRHEDAPLPMWSVIGGKLTTARSLADETARAVLDAVGAPHVADSRERRFPGNQSQPAKLSVDWAQLARQHGLTHESVHHVWSLVGTETPAILGENPADTSGLLPDVQMPERFARWSIRNEWTTTLDDLVERRLMLLYHQRLTRSCLRRLAELLVEEGKLAAQHVDAAIESTVDRLSKHFGKRVEE
jgi:glycerol-3-phosphate dehydrogenase